MSLTVYSKPACVQCNATYRRLDANGIEHEIIDVSQDAEALDMVKGLGHLGAPVVVLRDDDGAIVDHWGGYNPDKIDLLAMT